MSLLNELKRRNVFRVGLVYLATGWLIAQVTAILVPAFAWPAWVLRTVIIVLAVGFPIALVIAWLFELTPEGLKRTAEVDEAKSIRPVTGRKLDRILIGVLALIVAAFAVDRFVLEHSGSNPNETAKLATASDMPSIAVLPFADLSPQGDQGYFADGLSEELLNKLAQLQDLRVIGRTSSFAFKGKNEDLRTIGKTLGVNHILEGSVRKAGNEVRITAQLINAANGSHVWSKTYDRELNDIFAIQDDIAMAVADGLQVTLGVGELAHQPGMTRNVAAYDEYLAGINLSDVTEKTIRASIGHLEKAVALDPDFALAWLGLAQAYRRAAGTIPDGLQEYAPKFREALKRARQLAPNAPQVLFDLAQEEMNRSEWDEADQIIRSGLASGAEDSFAQTRGLFLYLTGHAKEAVGYLELARTADPLDNGISFLLLQAYAAAGDLKAALAEADRAVKVANAPSLNISGPTFLIALAAGDRAEINKWLSRLPDAGNPQNLNVILVKSLDDPTTAIVELHRAVKDPAYQSPLFQSLISSWAAYFDDQTFALKLFRDVAENVAASVGQFTAWRPVYRDIRKLPGFKDYLRKIGLVDYWRKSGDWGRCQCRCQN